MLRRISCRSWHRIHWNLLISRYSSASLKSLQDQLVDAKQEQTTASNIAKAKQIEVSRLLAENAKLKESLAKTSATLPAGTEASDLQERITGKSPMPAFLGSD